MKRKPLLPNYSKIIYGNGLYNPRTRGLIIVSFLAVVFISFFVLIFASVIFYNIIRSQNSSIPPAQTTPELASSHNTQVPIEEPTQNNLISPIVVTEQNIVFPLAFDFSACQEPCNGNNSTKSFPGAIKNIYVQWNYENIPFGAEYVRSWAMDEKEWIRYECSWNGSESGQDSVILSEPKGLHSGTWELTISVAGKTLLKEQIYISGNWDYWDPAGTLHNCYGKTD